MKYRIVPKRDFGDTFFLINGKRVNRGYVVTYAEGKYKGCNAMPAATWAQDIPSAIQMIRVLKKTGDDSQRFWRLLYRVNGATARNRELIKRSRAIMQNA